MSAKIMGAVWDLDLPHAEAFVLLAMADHADHDGGSVRPSFGLIAWKTGYSERQVRRIVATLTTRGILILEASGKDDGTSNTYRINLSVGIQKKPYKRDKMSYPGRTKRPTSDGQNVLPGRTHGCPTGSDIAMSYKPSVTVIKPSESGEVAEPSVIVTVFDPSQKTIETKIVSSQPEQNQTVREVPPPADAAARRDLWQAVADTCKIDLDLASKWLKKDMQDVCKAMHEKGITAAQVRRFARWFKVSNWRGQKDETPTLKLLGDLWGEFAAQDRPPASVVRPTPEPERIMATAEEKAAAAREFYRWKQQPQQVAA